MRPARRLEAASLLLAGAATGVGAQDGAWSLGLPGADAVFSVRHQLAFPVLDGGGFLGQVLALLGTAPLLLLLGALLVSPLAALVSGRTAAWLRGLGLLVVGLALALMIPCALALAGILAIEGGAGSSDAVVGAGLVTVALVYALPLGVMVRQRRLHKGTSAWELLGAPLLPVVAVALHGAGLQVGALLESPAVSGLYQVTLVAGGWTPAWIALQVLGGLVLLSGVVLAPVALQGYLEALAAARSRLLG